jgi:hypothetical protein
LSVVSISSISETVSSEFINVPSISDSDIKWSIQCLRSSESACLDEMHSFIIEDCSGIFAPAPKHIYLIEVCQRGLLSLYRYRKRQELSLCLTRASAAL